jgi:DNA mismatch repair protein MutS2
MEDLQKTRLKLDEDSRRIAALREEADAAARVQKDLAERLAGAEQETRKTVRKKITDELLKARAEVQAVLDELKTEKKLVKAREAKERLSAIEGAMQSQLARTGDYRPVEELQVGDRVEVTNLGTVGVLLENPAGKKRVKVRMGEKEVSVSVSVLAGLAEGVDETKSQATRGKPTVGARHAVPLQVQEASTVVDVRGKTADEALDALLACLDQAALAEVPLVRVIHGHGTGRLKQALRDYLKNSPYVSTYRRGEQGEGGDGVTVVQLK